MNMSEAMVGERLRSIRRQKGLSLHDVEARSSMEFKASVLGAYERGERAISVPRLLRLAEIYEVPADQLLPRRRRRRVNLTERDDRVRGRVHDRPRATARARRPRGVGAVARTPTTIQLQRQDFNGRLLTIRRDDLRVLAAVLGRRAEDLGRDSTSSASAPT